MTTKQGLKKHGGVALVFGTALVALLAAIFPSASLPAAGSASTGSITSEVIQSTGGGGFTARNDCPPGHYLETIYFRKFAFDGANAMTMVEGSCRAISSDGLTVGALGPSPGSWVGTFISANQFNQRCGNMGSSRVPVGARIYKTQNGYASGYQFICRDLPDTRDSTEYWTNVISGENPVNSFEDVRCPTGTAVLGLYLTYGSIVDRIGFRCGSITGATQTVTFGALSDRTLGLDSASFTIAASTNGAGSLGFTSSTTNVCTVSGSTVSLLSGGTCTITATATSTTNWASASQARSFTVQLPPQPSFSTPIQTFDGYTVQITNYQSSLTWTGTATNGGNVAINSTGLVTVTGLEPGASSIVTISNHPGVSATVSSSAIPLCSTTSSSQAGYKVVKITAVGTCNWVTPATVSSIQVAVVGGGGGGGFGALGGGGGAGEVLVSGAASLTGSPAALSVTSISGLATAPGTPNLVSIGAGGNSGAPSGANETTANWVAQSATANFGGDGLGSRFGNIVADGGGGGGGSNRNSGATGGSGGGAAMDSTGGGTDSTVPTGWTSFKNSGQAAGGSGRGSGGGAGSAGSSEGGGRGVTIWGVRVAGGGGGWGRLGSERSLSDSTLGGNGRSEVQPWPYTGSVGNYTSPGVNGTGTGGGSGAPGGSGLVLIRYPETNTITYDYNGATAGNTRVSDQYTTDGVVVTLPLPTRSGYRFEGWFEESNFSGTALSDAYTTTQTRTIYAKWSPLDYTILFEYNGATSQNTTSSSSYTSGTSGISLPAPLRSGHTFGGWFTSSNFVGSAVTAPFTTSVNQTLYAKWNAIDYTISYSSQVFVGGNTISPTSGTVPNDANTYNIGNVAPVLANTGALARAGYNFAGWVTSSDGSGSPLNSGDSITFAASDVVLYPKWNPGQYSISYNVNGASGTPARSSDTYTTLGTSITLPGIGSMVRSGYTFGGWSTSVNGSVLSNSNFTTTQDVVLYAVWSLTDFTLSFDLNGGSGGAAPTSLTANIDQTVTIPDIGSVTKSGHWFSGWNTEPDGSGSDFGAAQSLKMPLGGATLYAVWVPDQYRISYNANGGVGGPVIAGGFDTATFSQPYTIRDIGTLARPGYTFAHWSTTAGGAGLKYTSDVNVQDGLQVFTPSANTTFYAQWTPIDYTFSFDPNGGSISPPQQSKTIGQLLTLPDPGFKTGYSFAGWSDGVRQYQAQTQYLVSDSATAFVATWNPNVYRVSFDWQGAAGTPTPTQMYTYGTGGVNLPGIGDRVRDGYSFSGWALASSGNVIQSFEPTSDSTLYAQWVDGNFAINYNSQGGTLGSTIEQVARGTSTLLPTPVRAGFVFLGWFTDPTAGLRVGNAGASFTPVASQTLHARWVQRSLFGVDPASLENGVELTASSGSALDTTITHLASSSSARVQVPAGSLPNGTKINVRYFKDTLRQSDLIPGENNYLFSVLVSWLLGTGANATVPSTDPNKPISVTLENSSIRAGASIYMLIGDQVTNLGTANQDGRATVQLFEDPELVVAQTRPSAPTSVSAVATDSAVVLSWSPPANNGGAQINSYTVTANPGGASCITGNLTCTISGLTNGTTYTFTITAQNSVGISAPSTPTPGITPAPESFVVTFDSNGGSAVGNGNFIAGGSISQPTNPTRSGYNFVGWSTTRDDIQTRVTFPYTPSQSAAITLYGLWDVSTPVALAQLPGVGQASLHPDMPIGLRVIASGTVSSNDKFVLTGSNLDNVTLVRVGGAEASFFVNSDGKITIRVPANAPDGNVNIELVGSFGSLTIQGAININRISDAIDRRITIGSFLGKAAVYTKNHEGKRLSIKVGHRWFVIDPLKQNYTIHLTKVGSGKTVTVKTYLNRKLIKVQEVVIR